MKKAFLILALLVLASVPAKAQVRVLAGLDGGDSYDNQFFGGQVAVEIPFLNRFEFDIKDDFSPIENHTSLGKGHANNLTVNGIVWLVDGIGINSSGSYSTYDVTKVAKGSDYFHAGPILRKVVYNRPSRWGVDYVHQVFNGINPSGVETSHLNGADAYFDVRLTCIADSRFCLRIREDWTFGRVLTQGNQFCDGSVPKNSPVTCPRSTAFGGGWEGSIRFEFGNRDGHELDTAF